MLKFEFPEWHFWLQNGVSPNIPLKVLYCSFRVLWGD